MAETHSLYETMGLVRVVSTDPAGRAGVEADRLFLVHGVFTCTAEFDQHGRLPRQIGRAHV